MNEIHEDTNRVKILSLDCRLLIVIFNWMRQPATWLAIPELPDLPNDFRVLSVHANWECRSIDATIWHASFDRVSPGYMPPRVPGLISNLRLVQMSEVISHLRPLKETILEAVNVLSFNPAITDTLWMPGENTPTVVESLCDAAAGLGASDQEIATFTQHPLTEGERVEPAKPGE